MTADYTVSCDSSEYRLGFIWACVMIFVYPIGCPAYYFYLLYGVRHEIQLGDKETMLERVDESVEMSEETRARQEKLLSLRFLYESYQPRYWWWEIAETSQRLLLTGILVLIAQGSAIQIVVGALLTLSFLHLYARYEPFTDGFVLSIKIVSYWQILFVFWIALLIKADFPSMSDHILGICLVMVIFANLFVDVWKVCRIAFFTSSDHFSSATVSHSQRGSSFSSFPTLSKTHNLENSPLRGSLTEMGEVLSPVREKSLDSVILSSSPLHPSV
jgi:hypothetical protein